jgi:chromosome partitioning protein
MQRRLLIMPILSLVNTKGGSGKSTLAVHIAAWWAREGHQVALGDIDRQRSARTWLGLRPAKFPKITPWVIDQAAMLRLPLGSSHGVLDTPGGMNGLLLSKVVMASDAVLVPVGGSVFDRSAAELTLEEMRRLPRVVSGKCKLGVVAMRIDQRSNTFAKVQEWAKGQGVPLVTVLRDSLIYEKCTERGLSIFDLTQGLMRTDQRQWMPLFEWLDALTATSAAVAGQESVRPGPVLAGPSVAPIRTQSDALPAAGAWAALAQYLPRQLLKRKA